MAACRGAPTARSRAAPEPLPVARPQTCEEVSPGQPLQALIERAPDGSAVCLRPGVYPEHIPRRSRPSPLWGRAAVIRSDGRAPPCAPPDGDPASDLLSKGSGSRCDKMDSGPYIQGDESRREGAAAYPPRRLWRQCRTIARPCMRGNVILGTGDAALGLRGDGIRFWEVTGARIEQNFVTGSRDLVIRYTKHTRIAGNTVTAVAMDCILMYSSDVTLEDNRSLGNVVGTFIMYSRDVRYLRNLIAASSGAAGIGLGMKESGNVFVQGNVSLRNNIGLYLDTSPLQLGDSNSFRHNAFRLCNSGVIFHSSQRGNTFSENSFRDNLEQVRVEGGGDALAPTGKATTSTTTPASTLMAMARRCPLMKSIVSRAICKTASPSSFFAAARPQASSTR